MFLNYFFLYLFSLKYFTEKLVNKKYFEVNLQT